MPNKILDKHKQRPELLTNCEFDQVIKSGIVTPQQCYGVEMYREIYEDNIKVPLIHSYYGDFLDVMDQTAYLGKFNPSIVVYDSILYPETLRDYFPRMLLFLTKLAIVEVMVVWNFVIKAVYHDEFDVRTIPGKLCNNVYAQSAFQKAIQQKSPWRFPETALVYKGSGKGHQSKMASVIFYR